MAHAEGGPDGLAARVTLRAATAADIPLLLEFLGKKAAFDGVPDALVATADQLGRALFADPPLAHVLFAELGGRAVGFASYFFTFSTFLARPGLWLDDLYVDADVRSRGIGRLLLASLARLARSKGCGRIEWTAAVANERGLAFYRRAGATVREPSRLCRLDAAAIDLLANGPDDRPEPSPSRSGPHRETEGILITTPSGSGGRGFHGEFAERLKGLPTPEGGRYAVAYEHGTLSIGLFAPRGTDDQSSHPRDEIYLVVKGEGTFVNGEDRHRFSPGDLLFVPAGIVHRFEDFTDDLAVWVLFHGPDGGERTGEGR
jgi:GNAT superfamily N-acetyltransferase/mannose-6-phosphate isomerase-like protein (cupin superfamily)